VLALVTGASSGIGKVFAKQLAQKGYDLIITARSLDKLQTLKQKLESKYQVKVKVICQDLSLSGAGKSIFEQIEKDNLIVDLLINNAGFGDYGKLGDRPLDKQLQMIQVNISTLVELTYLFLGQMKERNSGSIINVSSIAGYQPMPYLSVYAATKAFVLSFSEALWAEYSDDGIKILALCPGATESNFLENAEFPQTNSSSNSRQNITSAEDVVTEALSTIENEDKSNLVTGGIPNQLIVNMSRFLPRETITKLVRQQFKNIS